MTLRPSTIYADAWTIWKTDWRVLTAVAGMFVFLPQLTLLLLVPDVPDMSTVTGTDPNDPTMRAYTVALQTWVGNYGLLYLSVVGAALYGQFALVALYLTPTRATVGGALGTAIRLLPRLLLASAVWALPLGLIGMVLMRIPFLILPLFALILARTLLTGPAIIAARPIGAVAALGRSFVLTRGNMLLLASVVLSVTLAQYLVAMPFVALDQWMAKNAPNPIARVMVDAAAAGIVTLGATAMALIQVAVWRRLSQR